MKKSASKDAAHGRRAGNKIHSVALAVGKSRFGGRVRRLRALRYHQGSMGKPGFLAKPAS